MDKILLGTAIAFIITFAAIPVIIKMSEIKKLFDIPDAENYTPYLFHRLVA